MPPHITIKSLWQHARPLKCPKGTPMTWLGGPFWLCGKACCNQVWVQRIAESETSA